MPHFHLPFLPSKRTMLKGSHASYLRERLEAMRCQEEAAAYKQIDYMAENEGLLGDDPIDDECRTLMCDWCYRVADNCDFQRETISQAFSYLDRYLCTKQGRKALGERSIYQLVAMTALYIAVKIHESTAIDLTTLVQWGAGSYSEKDFKMMEIEMLKALKWRVNGPTAVGFIRCFIGLACDREGSDIKLAIINAAQYQVELAVYSNRLIGRRTPEIAVAAIVNAIMDVDDNVFSLEAKREFVRSLEQISGLTVINDESLQIQYALSSLQEGMAPLEVSQKWNNDNDKIDDSEDFESKTHASSSDQKNRSISMHQNSPVSTAA